MKNYLLSVVLLFAVAPYLSGQDIHFSQYNYSNLTTNPSLTSLGKDYIATLNHKEQWRSVQAYRTSQFSFEMKVAQPVWEKQQRLTGIFKEKLVKGLALGINIFSDNAGDGSIKQTQANLNIAYHELMDANNSLSLGLAFGLSQHVISMDGLRWSSQYLNGIYDPSAASGENFASQSFLYFNMGAGALWSYTGKQTNITSNDKKQINIGLAAFHVNRPDYSSLNISDPLKMRIVLHANSMIGIKNSHLSVGPTFLYQRQGRLKELILGTLLKYKLRDESKYTGYIKNSSLYFGVYYRNRDAIIPQIVYEINSYSLGISYDANISGLHNVTHGMGGFEIMLRFNNASPFIYQNKSRM